MKESAKPQFDRYAKTYTDMHGDSIRASGEAPAYFASYKANYLASRVGREAQRSGVSILDFGCGIGNTISHLRNAFPLAQLDGVDLSSESIRIATEVHSDEATFKVIEGQTIPHADQSFDVVMAACVFHHIPPPERSHWMSEIRRVTKPGGSVFVFEHNILNPLTVKAVRDCPFDEDAILLPKTELVKLTLGCGLKDVTTKYVVFFPHALAVLRPLESSMGWIPFGAQYVVHGTN